VDQKGAAAANGRACVIECSTFDKLIRICKRATSSRNIHNTLDYIEVNVENHFLSQDIYTDPELDNDVEIAQMSTDASLQTSSQHVITSSQLTVDSIPVQTSVMATIDVRQPPEDSELTEIPSDRDQCELHQISRKTTNNTSMISQNVGHGL